MQTFLSANPLLHSYETFLHMSRFSQEFWAAIMGGFADTMFPPTNDNDRAPTVRSTPFESLAVGQSYTAARRITQEDIHAFADLTGDDNPAHTHPKGVPMFGRPIAHGILSGSAISAVLAMKLPGPGTIYLEQTFKFRRPIFAGETIEASVTISELNPERRRVTLDTVVRNEAGETAIEGRAIVLIPKND